MPVDPPRTEDELAQRAKALVGVTIGDLAARVGLAADGSALRTKGRPGEIYFISDGEPVELRDFITKLLATQGVDAGTRSVPRWVARGLVAVTSWMKRPPLTRMAFALMAHEVTIDDSKARRELGYVGTKTVAEGLAEL